MNTADVITQIDYVLDKWQTERNKSQYDDLGDQGGKCYSEIATMMMATIERLSPHGSKYRIIVDEAIRKHAPDSLFAVIPILLGILRALKTDYEQGYLQSIEELVQADMFSDFLEMAEYLLQEGYKDPAAVLVGGVLEEHLRKLCIKNGIAINDSNGKAKKASLLNDELAKCAYDKLEQKGVTFWLDLRNKAAHGKYSEYDKAQVEIMLQGVQQFIIRQKA